MNVIEKKHFDISTGDRHYECVDHATITKDVAVGFSEWIVKKGFEKTEDIMGNFWWDEYGYDDVYSTSELYDLYIKSLKN